MSSNRANRSDNNRKNQSMARLGLLGIPGVQDMGNDDDDDDLEAELAALISGQPNVKPPPKRKPEASLKEIDAMAAACMKDEVSDDDSDENDTELLLELQGLAIEESDQPSIAPSSQKTVVSNKPAISLTDLQSRLESYVAAENGAKSAGNISKARRFNRAIKALKEQIKMVNSGKSVPEEEIPPPLPNSIQKSSGNNSSHEHSQPIESPPPVHQPEVRLPSPQKLSQDDGSMVPNLKRHLKESEDLPSKIQAVEIQKPDIPDDVKENHKLLVDRRDQYKAAALAAKGKNDKVTAIKYIGITKQFNSVISALENGQPVDLSKMPPPPPKDSSPVQRSCPPCVTESTRGHPFPNQPNKAEVQKSAPPQKPMEASAAPKSAPSHQSDIPATPASITEALNIHLEKFKAIAEEAKQQGDNRKVRRLGRIIKDYTAAITRYKGGKEVNMEELPPAPGCPPIPNLSAAGAVISSSRSTSSELAPGPPRDVSPTKQLPVPPTVQLRTKPLASDAANCQPVKRALSRDSENQLQFLLQRQKYFKMAALERKKAGDKALALDYLKNAKGIQQMIEAARSGLPVDLTSVPVPPQLKEDLVIVDNASGVKELTGDAAEMYETLDKDLLRQLKLCLSNKEKFTKLGDTGLASRFENLAIDTKRDVQVIRNSVKRNDPIPRFHYETRTFSIVQCNKNLSDNEMELTIIRGINLPGTKDLDTFVRYEFPQPSSEDPQTNKTSSVKNTTNPVYDEKFTVLINRKAKSTARLFRRNALKIEVFSKGGFFSSDSLIGSVKPSLNILESKCQLHESYEIFNGRKNSGGKLELEIKVKEPLITKQVETLKERWLVIGS